jgi:hypothetical protein
MEVLCKKGIAQNHHLNTGLLEAWTLEHQFLSAWLQLVLALCLGGSW